VNIARFNLSRETAATIERSGDRAELITKPSMKLPNHLLKVETVILASSSSLTFDRAGGEALDDTVLENHDQDHERYSDNH